MSEEDTAQRSDEENQEVDADSVGIDEREYSLVEHLSDLRKRLVRASIGVLLVSLGCMYFSLDILQLLKEPLEAALAMVDGGTAKFVVISPAEHLISQLKAAIVAAIFIASPWIFYQMWLFISPGLYKREQRYVVWFVWAGSFFFCAGAFFAYKLVFPGMFRFFILNTMEANVEMTLSIAEHFSFCFKLLLAFGVVFQSPVVVYILCISGVTTPKELASYRAYVVVAGFVLGAILTPPDVISQIMLAAPLVVLFEAGLLAARIALYLQGKREKEGELV